MFCPVCGSEYREGFWRCADCDRELVDELPVGPIRPDRQITASQDSEEEAELAETSAVSLEKPAILAGTLSPERLRALELLLVLLVAFALPLLSSTRTWLYGAPTVNPDRVQGTAWLGIVESSLAVAVMVYVLFRQGRSLRSLVFRFAWTDVPIAFLLMIASDLAVGVTSTVIHSLYSPAGGGVPRQTSMSDLLGASWLAVLYLLTGALKEELIVRGFLMTEVAALTGSAGLAIAASVGLQSLLHLYYGVPTMLALAAGFAVFALYYWNSRRILPVILAHLAHNLYVQFSNHRF